MSERQSLPLFPLSTLVLPEGLLPLRLFERRYLDMISACLKSESGFGVCLIREGQEAGTPAVPYSMGTEVTIVDFDQGKDGLLHIVAQGRQEFVLHDFKVNPAGLLIGEVELLPRETTPVEGDFSGLAVNLEKILDYLGGQVDYPVKRLDDAEWVTCRLLELLPLEPRRKFDILQLRTLQARLDALLGLSFSVQEADAKDV
ncbi:MAG: LON peptidase substrate-binding domain-containing protein [Gammaproteobacteria bacterium]|nr:LON peptidase substrate-binding domain-containing protein [Gammaproteobacteria bacterium]